MQSRKLLCLVFCVLLAGCGSSRPADGGYTAGIAKPKLTPVQRLDAAKVGYQRGLRWYANQDNSCNKPSQWFPAADCVLSAAQLKNLAANLEDANVKVNTIIREYNAWIERGSAVGDDAAFVKALIPAESAITALKVPASFVAP